MAKFVKLESGPIVNIDDIQAVVDISGKTTIVIRNSNLGIQGVTDKDIDNILKVSD